MDTTFDTTGIRPGMMTAGYSHLGPEGIREMAREKLTKYIGVGQERAAGVVQRVLSEVPRDRYIPAPAFQVTTSEGEAFNLVAGPETALVHQHALDQVAQRAGMQLRYLHDLVQMGQGWARELAAQNLNTLLGHSNERYLVRQVGNTIRGVLSDSYRRIDSRPSVDALVGEAQTAGAAIIDGIYTETRVSLKIVRPTPVEVFPGEWMVFGLDYSNSDYGDGAHEISAFLLRLACLNGAVTVKEVRRVHLGRRFNAADQFSERTMRLDAAAQASATRDQVRQLLSAAATDKLVDQVRQANNKEIAPEKAEAFLKTRVNKTEAQQIVDKFNSADVVELPPGQTTWRFSNAISWLAKNTEEGRRRMELERLAGEAIG
jgi:hypothetical protein